MYEFLEKAVTVFPKWLAFGGAAFVILGTLTIAFFPRQLSTSAENRLADACAVLSWIAVLGWIFFLPTELAFSRKHHNLTAVAVLNAILLLFEAVAVLALSFGAIQISAACFGSALIAWILTLVWSLTTPAVVIIKAE
jgi:hypothetical protein